MACEHWALCWELCSPDDINLYIFEWIFLDFLAKYAFTHKTGGRDFKMKYQPV